VKLLYADDVRVPWTTARAVQVLLTCAALKRAEQDISLVCLRGPGDIASAMKAYGITDTFPVSRLPDLDIRYVRSIWFRSLFSLIIAMRRKDVVYTRDLGISAACAIMGTPFALELHSMPVRPQQVAMLKRTLASSHMAALFPITAAIRNALIEQFGAPQAKLHVLPCAADSPVNAPISQSDGEPLTVAYIGHLYPGKGGETLLALAKEHSDVRFEIVGDACDFSEPLSALPNVTLHGNVVHTVAMQILGRAHVALAPYAPRTEAVDGKVISDWFSPLKVFEYMAHGKAIATSDLPVIREVLTHDQNALLVPPGEMSHWHAALERLKDTNLRTRLANNARLDFERHYSYDRRAAKIVDALAGLKV